MFWFHSKTNKLKTIRKYEIVELNDVMVTSACSEWMRWTFESDNRAIFSLHKFAMYVLESKGVMCEFIDILLTLWNKRRKSQSGIRFIFRASFICIRFIFVQNNAFYVVAIHICDAMHEPSNLCSLGRFWNNEMDDIQYPTPSSTCVMLDMSVGCDMFGARRNELISFK